MSIMEIHGKNIISFPNFPSTKQGQDQDFCFCGGSEKSRLKCLNNVF